MRNYRPFEFSLLPSFLKRGIRNPFSIIGICVIVVSLVFFITQASLISIVQKPHEKYNHKMIEEKGLNGSAKITEISTLSNIRIFGKSPTLISYAYPYNNKTFFDKFQTMEMEKVNVLSIGQRVEIKIHNGQSIIAHMEPYRFPAYLFHVFPLLFGFIGLLFLSIGLFKS